MSSGTAFRCKVPNWVVLPCDRERNRQPAKLYKAPRNKLSKHKQEHVPLLPLPLEIINLIIMELDLPSIGMMRRVNTTGRLAVESLPAYSLLKKHASNTLRLMAVTKCAKHFSISWLFSEFCQPWCRSCGDFGPFLYFPTATRLCYKCNFVEPEYEIAETSLLRFNLAISLKQLRTIPIIHSFDLQPTRRFANITQAKALATEVHGSDKAIATARRAEVRKRWKAYERRVQKWERSTRNSCKPRGPMFSELRKYDTDHNRVFFSMRATAIFPYWDRQTRKIEPGVYCRACTYEAEELMDYWRYDGSVWDDYPSARWKAYHRAFLEADIPEHFLNCPAVKKNHDFRIRRALGINKRKGTDFIVKSKKASDV
ncbi:hypothetical protein P170DRAFT_436383 [Aspergillus steynii IBT 23096]|uniref:F-box domain-containing protein n=1 Tax=Aspergillus steynii IBT 23096 TaxID=1392250 RepID=A0A2I2GER0_9EURO|nr:uncharacterized protein P170DRAFT_436383 [Aspergillus steynii IBT 23096]PLB51352.1 hypothetical protein P170DRAFT_436383 [Aspergillus steynii IBT 23096]